MSGTHGFTDLEWARGKAEIVEILQSVAAGRGMITYGDLSRALRAIRIGPHEGAMASILGQISEEEDSKGHGMLSVVVVHKHGDMEPGNGFWECAQGLGKDVSDRTKFWIAELHKVHNHWSNKPG